MNTSPVRPTVVSAAFWIWLLSALAGLTTVIGMLVGVNVLATLGGLVSEDAELYLALTGFGIIVAYVALAGVIVQVVVSVFFRDGANWARIVLTVIAALAVVTVAIDPTDVGSWVFLVANLVAAVLSYLPEANAFFASSRVRRRTGQAAPVTA